MTDPGCRYNELAWRIRKLCKHYMRIGQPIPWEEVAETLEGENTAKLHHHLQRAALEAMTAGGDLCRQCTQLGPGGCNAVLAGRTAMLCKPDFDPDTQVDGCNCYDRRNA